MTKWKLCRQSFGNEEFTFKEGDEVTIGRGVNNVVTLSSLVISRNHCLINFQKNHLLVTDLKSSNGVFVGTTKIPSNTPFAVKNCDTIGFGWIEGIAVGKVQDSEKYVFKVIKEPPTSSIIERITFESECEEIEEEYSNLNNIKSEICNSSPIIEVKPTLKRKIEKANIKNEKYQSPSENTDNNVVSIVLSDSDNEPYVNQQQNIVKKCKLEPVSEECQNQVENNELNIKMENEYLEFEAFDVKQQYLEHDDELITIDSDSDCESDHWLMRLSQSSPGKPFTKIAREKKTEEQPQECSYSQMDDDPIDLKFLDDDDCYPDDIISFPPQPSNFHLPQIQTTAETTGQVIEPCNDVNDRVIQSKSDKLDPIVTIVPRDEVDTTSSVISKDCYKIMEGKSSSSSNIESETKKAQMIEPQIHLPKKKSLQVIPASSKSKSSKNEQKGKGMSKVNTSISLKEERKRKLKEIALKQKEDSTEKGDKNTDINNTNKLMSNIKLTTSNRGAFLINDAVQVVKPMKRKDSPQRSKAEATDDSKAIHSTEISKTQVKKKRISRIDKKEPKLESSNIENKKKSSQKKEKSEDLKHKDHSSNKSKLNQTKSDKLLKDSSESRVPLKILKPLTDHEGSYAGKPFSKVEPLPPEKPKKSVRFSEAEPDIRYFEIEEGNKMKKTSSIKTTLVDARRMPIFSLEKITLIKILRWNPHWLEEQLKFKDPPPILGHSSPPLAIFHSFSNHNQYVQLIGDLLLMEIWECLSLAYKKIRNQQCSLQMRIASLPPVPTQECTFDLFTFSVDVSFPTSDLRLLPRVGEILLVTFGPENAGNQRFFFVHNVRCLPSPPTNRNSFYNISLQATYTEKMKLLKPGEIMIGISLASINNELSLFEAMAYMACSPLSEAVLKPEPRHFYKNDNLSICMESQWTMALNPSQQTAVRSSVCAALGEQPCIQMVQGPPGTGKSSVICAIVMTYFYNSTGNLQNNRGKILICATSNAAVDEIVIRLLNIRQSLPKQERFRMVRVGRAEAMHPRARDVSSQQLAQRDAARLQQEPANPAIGEEISYLEAKINMWKTAAQDAEGKDPMRVAYCEGRASELVNRIALLRGGGSRDGPRPDQLLATERRIVEGANVIITTLSSAHNHKMRGLKRRIALCIVDEAGQAIEPETLIPLTLDVTKLTLIGDPQQLPGYICSPRAKKHGLGESLFSRLTSCTESWSRGNPVVLLNQQYRMHKDIADYPHRAFYGGLVKTCAPPRPDLNVMPYAIVGISSGDKGQNASGANEMEAWGVSRLASALASLLRPRSLCLAVITPYNAHKDLIKKYLRQLQDPSEPIVEVNTVDSFQGQERDVVVVSLARSHGMGFLTDAGRMNVMLTRAKHALIICLNPHAVLKNHQWSTLLEDAQKRKLYRTLPFKMCQPMGNISHEDILKHISMR